MRDEKTLTLEGIVAGLVTRPGTEATESPYVLVFAGGGSTVGDRRLMRISWTGDPSEAARLGWSNRTKCS